MMFNFHDSKRHTYKTFTVAIRVLFCLNCHKFYIKPYVVNRSFSLNIVKILLSQAYNKQKYHFC